MTSAGVCGFRDVYVFTLTRSLLCCLHWNCFSVAVVEFRDWTYPSTRSLDQTVSVSQEPEVTKPSSSCLTEDSVLIHSADMYWGRRVPSPALQAGIQQRTLTIRASGLAVWSPIVSLLKSVVTCAYTNSLLTAYLETGDPWHRPLCQKSLCLSSFMNILRTVCST